MTITIGRENREINNMITLGASSNSFLERVCACFFALAPILQHYRGLYENAGFTILLACAPILALRLLSVVRLKSSVVSSILPMLFFEVYTALIRFSLISRVMYVAFIIFLLVCIANGCVNLRCLFRWAIRIASANSAILVIQYFSYYVFHYRLDIRPLSLLVNQDAIWIRHQTKSFGTGLYRPAGFFLEPSHFFLYCLPLLCLLLLLPNMTKYRMRKAILLSFGLLLTTSGFGIVATLSLWGLYYAVYKNSNENAVKAVNQLFKLRTVIIFVVIIAVAVIAYFSIPFFQKSVNRILIFDGSSTAIDGRVRLAKNYVRTITGKARLIGQSGVASSVDFNLSGFFATYIKWGIIGIVLTYWYYGQGLVRLKRAYFWLTAMIIVISYYTAHTHGTFYMLYYILFLTNGYYEKTVV